LLTIEKLIVKKTPDGIALIQNHSTARVTHTPRGAGQKSTIFKKIDIAVMTEPRIIRWAVKMRMSRQKKTNSAEDIQNPMKRPQNGGKRQKAINA